MGIDVYSHAIVFGVIMSGWVSKGMRRQARASTQAQVARGTYAHRPLLVCAGGWL